MDNLSKLNSSSVDFQSYRQQASMVVRIQSSGRKVVGLRIGFANAQRYFPVNVSVIELQLDHLRIECHLSPEFWAGRPEIRDRRLCSWLEQKSFNFSTGDLPLEMIPCGNQLFRVQPLTYTPRGESSTASRPSSLTAA